MALSGQLGEFSFGEIVGAVGSALGRLRFWDLPGDLRLELDLGGGQILACRFNEAPVLDPEDVIEKLCLVAMCDVGRFDFTKQSEAALERLIRIPLQPILLEVTVRCDELEAGLPIYVPAAQKLRWEGMSPTTQTPEHEFLLKRGAAYFRNGASPADLANALGISLASARRFCTVLLADGHLVPVHKVEEATPTQTELQRALSSNDSSLDAMARSRWFYLDGTTEVGPVAGRQILEAISAGTLPPHVSIWRPDLPRWTPFEEVWLHDRQEQEKTSTQAADPEHVFGDCFVCKERHPRDEMLYYQGWHVCEGCRETFFKELVQNPVGGLTNAPPITNISFRCAAWLLDFAATIVLTMLLLSGAAAVGVVPVSFIFSLKNTLITGAVVSFALHVVGTRYLGRSPGKWAMRIQVVDQTSIKPLSFGRLLWRWLLALPPLFPLALFDHDNRGLHDLAAKSLVVSGPRWNAQATGAGATRFVRFLAMLGGTLLAGALALLLYRFDLQNELRRLADPTPAALTEAAADPMLEAQLAQRWRAFLTSEEETALIFPVSDREAEAVLRRSAPYLHQADLVFGDRTFVLKFTVPLRDLPAPMAIDEPLSLNMEARFSIENKAGTFRLKLERLRCKDSRVRGLWLSLAERAVNRVLERELRPIRPSLQRFARVESTPGALEFRR